MISFPSSNAFPSCLIFFPRMLIYNSLVRPYFEYCIKVWGAQKSARLSCIDFSLVSGVILVSGFTLCPFLLPVLDMFLQLFIHLKVD